MMALIASAKPFLPAAASVGAYGWGGAAYTRFWVDPGYGLIGVYRSVTLSFQLVWLPARSNQA